jgi:hypothetical protein
MVFIPARASANFRGRQQHFALLSKVAQGCSSLCLFNFCLSLFEPCLAHDMATKRPVSNRSDEEADNGDRVIKRQKILPHRNKFKDVMEEFLDLLTPATSKSLADFNQWERLEKRRGVTPIDTVLLEKQLRALQTMNTETLEAKLNKIDATLQSFEAIYGDYIDDSAAKGPKVQRMVEATLDAVIGRIQMAREQLPGMLSYWMNCRRKAKSYHP